jgi:hypothetical protein
MTSRLHALRPHMLLSLVRTKDATARPGSPLDLRIRSPTTRRNRTLLRKAHRRHIRPPNRPCHPLSRVSLCPQGQPHLTLATLCRPQ